MLTFVGRNCGRSGRFSRRDVLQIGALACGGLTLADVLSVRELL